ncbi:MAG: PIN domain-containing protein [Stackebrandtia sp.]
MIVIVADTSGLLAALDADHPDGSAAREVLDTAGLLVISPVLLAEIDHVATRVLGRNAAHCAVDDIRRWAKAGRVVLPPVTADILDTAQLTRRRYADLDLDLADAVNVAFAEKYRTDAILTLDRRDFRAVAPLSLYPAFRVLPDDR